MKLKNILSAIVVFGALTCATAFAADPAVTLVGPTDDVEAGSTFDVKVNLTSNPGVASLKFNVSYDDNLTITKVQDGGLLSPMTSQWSTTNFTRPEILYWVFDDMSSTSTATGTVATITFKVPENATAGTEYTFGGTSLEAMSEFDNYTVSVTGCTVKVKSSTPTSTTSVGAATQGAELDGNKTFYAPITIDTAKQSGARFQVSKGDKTKSWEIPSGIVGLTNFYAVVKTNETGTYTYNVVESDGTTAIGTAQTVIIQ